MNIDHPTAAHVGPLRALWKEAFGDSDAFLDVFFTTAYAPQRCRCITAGGRPEAALYWFDMFCSGQKFAYLYAVATAASSRGKGLCRTLMEDTAALLKGSGYHGALLVPQSEGLRAMYARMGYLPAAPIDEFFCAAGTSPVPLQEVTAEEYAALRPAFLPDGSVEPDGTGLAFLAAQARFYKGPGLLAAVSRETEHLRILEYLGQPSAAPALVAALGHTEATIRAPGDSSPFAMYLPLATGCKQPGYFAFCFD